jgi:protein transport protein HofC
MAKQKLFYFQAYDQRQQWQKGSLVAQSKQAAQFLLIAKGFNHIRLQGIVKVA